MTMYETIPTGTLAIDNQVDSTSDLPELVHLDDAARSVFLNFNKSLPAIIPPSTSLDEAIHDMKTLHLQLLLVEDKGKIVGLIGQEDVTSEKPILIMQQKGLSRNEITVDMLMKPRHKILVMDIVNLRNAKVGHIVKTFQDNSVSYILVIQKTRGEKHLIKGLFSALQIGRQLHADLISNINKSPESIIDLHKERSV